MWKAWNKTAGEDENHLTPFYKGDLVLSWKQLCVTVVKKVPKFFGPSVITEQQILDNGEKNV